MKEKLREVKHNAKMKSNKVEILTEELEYCKFEYSQMEEALEEKDTEINDIEATMEIQKSEWKNEL